MSRQTTVIIQSELHASPARAKWLQACALSSHKYNFYRETHRYKGVNVFHFTGGPCAEPVALGNAAAIGVLPADLRLMVAVKRSHHGDKMLVINPCGRCRQQLMDLSPAIKVVVIDEDASLKVVGIEDLLPFSYIWNRDKEIEVAEA